MNEPDDEAVRRWQEYTRPPTPDHTPEKSLGGQAPAGRRPEAPERGIADTTSPGPDPSGGFSARRMAMLGAALFVALALIAVLITWPSGGLRGGPAVGSGAEPAKVPKGSKPRNLVEPPGDFRDAQGTVISGVPWDDGHEPEKMIDGDQATSWSASGNLVTRHIRFELGDIHRITRVSLALPTVETRAITRVTWSFPDTSVRVTQVLRPGSTGFQGLDVGPVTTNVVVLAVDEVSSAPSPTSDFTGISEVRIMGY